MNIYVCNKQVPDTETKIQIKSDGTGYETMGIKWIVNPYDEFAIEEALKLRDKLADGSQVTLLSLGPKTRVVDALRTGLAMGADNATVIDAPESTDSSVAAKALARVIKSDSAAGIVFSGKQAIDSDGSQVSQMVAEFLGWPHASVVVKFEMAQDKATCLVERESDGGNREEIQLKLPAVVGAQKGLNTPRYASLPGIMKAKKKEIKEVALTSLGLEEGSQKLVLKNYQLPPSRPQGRFLEGAASDQASTLVKLLREEAKVI